MLERALSEQPIEYARASAHRRIGASAHRRIGASAHRRIGASALGASPLVQRIPRGVTTAAD
jgi:hypothetical protein